MSGNAAWWVTLGLGLVVAIVAVVLLEIFYRKLRQVEAGAAAIWQMGKEVARNTATTWLLPETSDRLDLLIDEAGRHVELLSPAPARQPS